MVFVIGFALFARDVQQGVELDDVSPVFKDVQAFSVVTLPAHKATDPYGVVFLWASRGSTLLMAQQPLGSVNQVLLAEVKACLSVVAWTFCTFSP